MSQDAIVVGKASFIIAWRALKGYALPDECTSRNSVFEGFAETLVFLSVTFVASSILCFNSLGLVNRVCLHLPCSRFDFLQIFQVKIL